VYGCLLSPTKLRPGRPDLWTTPGRGERAAIFLDGLSTALPYETGRTVNLKTHVHTQPVGEAVSW